MPGRPFMAALVKRVNDEGGPAWVCDMIADGMTVREVAGALGCSRRYVYMLRDLDQWNGEFKRMWDAAMKMSAEVEVEKAMADFERLDRVIDVDAVTGEEIRRVPTQSEVGLVTGRAKFRQWLAARKDPDTFGEQNAAAQVHLNIGSLHLDALQSVKARELAPQTRGALEGRVEEAEWEDQ